MVLKDKWHSNLSEIEPLDESDLSTLSELLVEFHDDFNEVFRLSKLVIRHRVSAQFHSKLEILERESDVF